MKTDDELLKMFQKYVEESYCSRFMLEKPDPQWEHSQPKCSDKCPFMLIDESCGYHEWCQADDSVATIGFIAGFRAAELLYKK